MKFISIMLIITMCASCTSLHKMNLPTDTHQKHAYLKENINNGDDVKVILKDGTQHSFSVTGVTNEMILGKDLVIPIKNINVIEIEKVDTLKTTGTVLLVVLGVGLWTLSNTAFFPPPA